MAINEHQLAESSISMRLYGFMRWCSCSVRTYLGALLLLPRVDEVQADPL